MESIGKNGPPVIWTIDHMYGNIFTSHRSRKTRHFDSIEQEIILNNIPKADVEVWRQVESNVIQEKNSVEGLIYMLSGLSNRSTLTYTKPRDSYDQSK